MAPKTIWTEETIVKSYETDFRKRWKPACFFQSMQEAATHHADHLGFPFDKMISSGMIWILSRIKIVFHRFPALHDKVIVQTWPKGIHQKIFFMRDFHFVDSDGLRFASATSAWLLVDPRARKLLMPSALDGSVPDNNGLAALYEPLEKIAAPVSLPEKFAVDVGYSDIDLMEHVNNARYIQWISDCFSIEEWASRDLASIQINYINELRAGERVSIAAGAKDGEAPACFVTGTNINSAQRAFEALVTWK